MMLDPAEAYMVLVTDFASKIDGLWAFQVTIHAQIERIAKTDWFDAGLSHLENKTRKKELGGFLFFSRDLLREFEILGMAKIFEDVLVEAKELSLSAFNIWGGDEPKLPYHHEMRCVRNLANVIKHNGSRIVAGGGEACRFLIEKAGFKTDTEIAHINFDLERALYQTYVFLDALSGHLTGVAVESPLNDATVDFEQFKSGVLPWFLKQ
jgi:hypothetical protein